MFVLWILLYVIGFVATTITMKYFNLPKGISSEDWDWWCFAVMWPLCVPFSLTVIAVVKVFRSIGNWWDRISDEIVEKLQRKAREEDH